MAQNNSTDTDRLSQNFQLSDIILAVSKLNIIKKFSMVDWFFNDVQNYIPIHIDNHTTDFTFLFFNICRQIEEENSWLNYTE